MRSGYSTQFIFYPGRSVLQSRYRSYWHPDAVQDPVVTFFKTNSHPLSFTYISVSMIQRRINRTDRCCCCVFKLQLSRGNVPQVFKTVGGAVLVRYSRAYSLTRWFYNVQPAVHIMCLYPCSEPITTIFLVFIFILCRTRLGTACYFIPGRFLLSVLFWIQGNAHYVLRVITCAH